MTEEEDGGRRTTGATPGLVRGIARKSSGSELEATGAAGDEATGSRGAGDEATGSRGAAEVGAKRAKAGVMVEEVTVVRGWSGGRGGESVGEGWPVAPGTVKVGGEEVRRRGAMCVTWEDVKLAGTGGI